MRRRRRSDLHKIYIDYRLSYSHAFTARTKQRVRVALIWPKYLTPSAERWWYSHVVPTPFNRMDATHSPGKHQQLVSVSMMMDRSSTSVSSISLVRFSITATRQIAIVIHKTCRCTTLIMGSSRFVVYRRTEIYLLIILLVLNENGAADIGYLKYRSVNSKCFLSSHNGNFISSYAWCNKLIGSV